MRMKSGIEIPNSYAKTWLAIMNGDPGEIEDAEQLVTLRLRLDPTDPEGVLSWTLLELLYGRSKTANSRIAPLVKDFPANPYYSMAATEIIFQRDHLSDEQAINLLRDIVRLANDSPDVLAKLGCMAALRGFWSFSIPPFVDALRGREKNKDGAEEDLILLWKRNASSLNQLLESLPSMDQRGLRPYDFDDLPIETVARAFYVLFTANLAGIDEAWPPCMRIASHSHELQDAWNKKKIPAFLATHCSNWLIYQAAGSNVLTTPFDLN